MKFATDSFLIFLMSAGLANFAFAGGEIFSGQPPLRRAVQKYSSNRLSMPQFKSFTKTATSVGTSALQIDAIQTDLASDPGRRQMRAPALLVKGESTLVDPTSL